MIPGSAATNKVTHLSRADQITCIPGFFPISAIDQRLQSINCSRFLLRMAELNCNVMSKLKTTSKEIETGKEKNNEKKDKN